MNAIADFEFNQSLLSDGVVLVSQAIRRDFSAQDVRQNLQQLVESARAAIPDDLAQDCQLEKLIELFYHTWGFGGASGVYRLSDALWLDKVLESRQGMPVSLGIIFLHIAHELGLPLMPVIFPTQLILRADWMDEEMWLINPLNGDTLSEHVLDVWLKGNIGPSTQLLDEDLDEVENVLIVRKMLDTLKVALMEEKQMELALRASEAVLQFDPDDPYEIRDRGLIYAQLDCDHIALSDLSYFVEQCPEDPVSEMIKVQIHSIEQKQIVLH
ncbi:invasion regulator SirB1 [Samsonia erythrinae]|uniref:Regulator of sirC expression with transglutaminase-like and TPR domain n=1 Tax=Samsonia erythrinae TaxID=160434 RepID=A0A4R3VK63_9GAMM|nr:invasion regulator SirB1 [Samsonia erythrinae]TCV06323.1 regulator of sirC expression with transglutaminase-like and TPR domain [Samsonia erythrinae]